MKEFNWWHTSQITGSMTAPKLPKIENNAKFPHIQGFPQVLRTWGGSLKVDGGQCMGECGGDCS